ncbi:ThiF family adenylyltransferase [Novipirellula sp.]|uniref:ThiF family adenylyltransferase n=1 Tax=Novipirellula sp. TaxID=2795430 RepID=UPI00356823E5
MSIITNCGTTFQSAPTIFANPDANQQSPRWNYRDAFSRNYGLISHDEQERLRNCRVAIPGMGGVGGLHLVTLARLGIGKFTIADPDVFESVNFNRQYGASVETIGRPKVEVMSEVARSINPEVEISVVNGKVDHSNADDFLSDCDILVDGIDLYAIEARRRVFKCAAANNIPGVTAGPMGFSTCWLTFTPNGMTFDQYFDINDDTSHGRKVIAFLMGLCPRMLPLRYMDRHQANPMSGSAPSVSAGCQLAAGVMASEVVKILLGRGPVKPAPHYQIFDAYLGKFASGKLRMGNRSPLQRIKRKWLEREWKKRFETLEI